MDRIRKDRLNKNATFSNEIISAGALSCANLKCILEKSKFCYYILSHVEIQFALKKRAIQRSVIPIRSMYFKTIGDRVVIVCKREPKQIFGEKKRPLFGMQIDPSVIKFAVMWFFFEKILFDHSSNVV